MATQAKEVFLTPPLTIAGCRLWFDAADSSTITGTSNVTAWRDKTASLTLTGSGPTYSNVNGYPTLTFNGNQFISSRNLPYESVCTSDANFTTFMVQLTTSSSGVNGIPFMIYLTDNVRRLAVFSSGGGSGGIFVDGASQASPRLSGITQTLNIPQLFCITRKNITTMTARLNGSQVSSADFPGTTNFISSNSYFIYISSGAGPWTGNMYEILHYNRDISDLEIQQVEGYLAWKWGLQALLPRSHPFFSASPYQTLSVPISRSVPLRMSSSTYFSPTAISGCQLWMDAVDTSSMTLSGSTVTQWRDKSGNVKNTTSYAGTPTINTSAINGRQAITLNGSSSFTGSITGSGISLTVCIVGIQGSGCATDGGLLCFGRPGVADWQDSGSFTIEEGQLSGSMMSTRNYLSTQRTITGTNTPFIYILIFDGTYVNTYTNGTIQTPNNSSGSFAYTEYKIGTRAGNTGDVFWTGFIGEALVYNSAISTTQRQQIEGYLAWKWGLQASLPPTHPNFTIPYVPFPFPTSIPKAAIRDWSPLRVSGSQLWLDAADSSSITGTTSVTEWRDKSGNARHLGVGSGTTSYSLNAIKLNSSYMFVTSPVDLSRVTVFLVSKTNPIWNQPVFVIRPNTSVSYGSTDGLQISFYDNSYINVFTQTLTQYANPGTINTTLLSAQASDRLMTTWLNGANETSATNSSTRTSTAQGFSIGGEWNGSSYVNIIAIASINEIIVYNSALTTAQRQQVEGYLAWKWGLRSNLPAGHPYINFPPSP
jgi:hypothetical protein